MSNEALRRLAYWALDVAAGRIDPFDADYDPEHPGDPEDDDARAAEERRQRPTAG